MGRTHATITLRKDKTQKEGVEIDCLVDSGADYSVIPKSLLKKLEIEPDRVVTIILGDGTRIKRALGGASITFRGRESSSPVIFGEPSDEPILGVVSLENLGMVLDPLKRRIYPRTTFRM